MTNLRGFTVLTQSDIVFSLRIIRQRSFIHLPADGWFGDPIGVTLQHDGGSGGVELSGGTHTNTGRHCEEEERDLDLWSGALRTHLYTYAPYQNSNRLTSVWYQNLLQSNVLAQDLGAGQNRYSHPSLLFKELIRLAPISIRTWLMIWSASEEANSFSCPTLIKIIFSPLGVVCYSPPGVLQLMGWTWYSKYNFKYNMIYDSTILLDVISCLYWLSTETKIIDIYFDIWLYGSIVITCFQVIKMIH